MDKKEFVERHRIHTVNALFPQVEKLFYRSQDNPECERVYAEIAPSRKIDTGYIITINVTGDSLIALTRDVLRRLEEKYV
ncbi:MAG: hypothetical protein J1F04_01725 [Oscillospiraceae bacterium]|nr:hypothetical protein [Oscillospiraceae bacterium]